MVGYTDIEQAFPNVDAVVIATPQSTHARLSLQAIEAGKRVLVEKPLATTTAEAQLVVDAAELGDLVLMAGHTIEHNAAVHKLRDLGRSNELGKLYYLDCARLNLGLYQPDVGVIMDLAPHDISVANFVLGSRPTAVAAWGSRHVHPAYEDVAHLLLDYGDVGVPARIQVSWLSPQKFRRVTAVGSKKMAVVRGPGGRRTDPGLRQIGGPPEGDDGPLSRVACHPGDMVAPFVPFAEPLAVQDQNFVDCITDGSRPSTDGNSGLNVVQVLECAQISTGEQRPAELTEVTQVTAAVPAQRLQLRD